MNFTSLTPFRRAQDIFAPSPHIGSDTHHVLAQNCEIKSIYRPPLAPVPLLFQVRPSKIQIERPCHSTTQRFSHPIPWWFSNMSRRLSHRKSLRKHTLLNPRSECLIQQAEDGTWEFAPVPGVQVMPTRLCWGPRFRAMALHSRM